jgi:two-component system sensor kinase
LDLTRPEAGAGHPVEGGTLFGGRYLVVRSLKKGQGVETLLATDQTNNRPVVIKTSKGKSLSLGTQMRLEHEAGVLRQIRSPWIAPLFDFGREDDLLLLAMPFIPGVTLAERLAKGPLSVRDAITVGRCLMSALADVHVHGVLHRDVKPANIIVDENAPLEKATLIDFGLARSANLDLSIRDQPVGTARYVSPEQAGLLDQDPDERSDLYSAGVVLFECLVSRPPFVADSIGEVLRQHMTVRPPELRSLGLAIPRALDEIIQRLLRKDPRDRYQSAEGVLADLAHLTTALDRGIADPPLVVGSSDRRKSLTEPAFVGREAELAVLDLQFEQTRKGEGGLVLLEAESGGGKTRLLMELAQRCARQGAWVLRGQGLDQQAQRPFQVLAGVAAEVTSASRRESALGEAIQARLGDHREAACAALPELADIMGPATAQALGPESFGQIRSLQALATLLDALGSADRPALVLLDDCQWADELTQKLLGQWLRHRHAEKRYALLVVAFRSEDVPREHGLRRLGASLLCRLPPFQAKDVRRLAESMAGPLPAEALEVVERLSEGSPFMAAAVLQGLVESAALLPEPAGWRVAPQAMADVQSSRHAAAFLVHRIEMLPPPVLELLSAGAVLGKDFDLDLAATLANQSPGQAIAALDQARGRHIVWARLEQTRCSFVHDKLRQTLLQRLDAGQRQDLHRRAALHLEKQRTEQIFELAYHFDAAGQSNRALPFALTAAEKARAQHSLELAEEQYRIAARGVQASDEVTRVRIAEGLGDVLMLRGRYDQAARLFQTARTLARGDALQAKIEGKLGELAFKRGDVKNASETIERALRLLGRQVPRWSIAFYLLVVWEVLVQALHTLCPRFLGRRPLAGADNELLAIRLYSRLAHLYWFHRGTVPALWSHLHGLNLAERYPPCPELAQAYSEHAPGMSLIPYFSRGIAYAEKSLAIRKQLGDLWGQGQSLHFYGVVLYASSRYKECIEKCREAVRLLERTGDYWEVNIARYQIAASLHRLGDLAGAVAEAKGMYQSGLELGDAQASGISLDVWARASLGRLPPGLIATELDRPTGDVQRTAQVLAAQGTQLLYGGDVEEAARAFEKAHLIVRQAGVKNAWVSPLLPWLATALRRQAENSTPLAPRRRAELLRRAEQVARWAVRLTRSFQNDLPHALRESALLAALRDRPRRARRLFDEALAVAERQGAIYEHAQTLLAAGQVGLELDWPEAADDVAVAQQTLRTLEGTVVEPAPVGDASPVQAVTLSLADRFDTVLDAGRKIASALSREAIFAAVREAALRLLRAEQCLIVKVEGEPGDPDLTPASGEIKVEFSRTLVKAALSAGRAIALVEGAADHSSESVVLAMVRSALCAPIFTRGRAGACFMVSHRQVAGLFGADEERLADFIATLAGAALENAEGFTQLRRLNETLEHQVVESKRAENRIKEQAALLDQARDAISVEDLEDRILFWNQSAERLYGWTAAEALGKKVTELLSNNSSAQREVARRTVLERGEWMGELRHITRSGREMIVESRWTSVGNEAGQPKSILIVSTDVTEKNKLETQLLRSQRMDSLGTLAGGIAHDINNLLTPIIMGVDLLKMNLPPEQRTAILADLKNCAARGADMMKHILSFARGVKGERTFLRLRHVVRELDAMLQHTFPKSIVLKTEIARDLWGVNGDATQLHQMLMNLCVNARDAMPQGGTLTIALENVVVNGAEAHRHPGARPGKYVLVKVEDTGSGMPPEVLDRIFDPFFTTKEFGKGTGLGLSTVVGIVKGHGGVINVSSVVGAGTQFTVYLPAVENGVVAPAREDPGTLPEGHGELILVVDDEASILQLTRTNLETHGYRVLTARDGIEASNLYAQRLNEVQVVVTDMAMPRLDGQSTMQRIRGLNPSVRIIASTGLPTSLEAARKAGVEFQASLLKPFTVHKLLQTVDQVLHAN